MEDLQRYANDYDLDSPEQLNGKTNLMLACLDGCKDTVESLLETGANVLSVYGGYTPMHFACMREDLTDSGEEDLLGSVVDVDEEERIAIIKLLLKEGASLEYDPDGLSPPEVAALSRMKDVVGFFLWNHPHTPVKVKIRAAEILGVSQVIHERDPNFEAVFSSFSLVFEFRKNADLLDVQRGNSKLAQCFSEISLEECCTADDLERLEQRRLDSVGGNELREFESDMKAHAFLIGDRSYPEDFKKCLFNPFLVRFAEDLFNIEQWNKGFKVLVFALGLERSGHLKLGVVASYLAKSWRSFARLNQLQHARDLLHVYESVINDVSTCTDMYLPLRSDSLMESFCRILKDEAFHCAPGYDLKPTLLAIEKLLKVVRSIIYEQTPLEYPRLSSVTFKIMDRLAGKFADVDSSFLLSVKYVMLNVLCSDRALLDSRVFEKCEKWFLSSSLVGFALFERKTLEVLDVARGLELSGHLKVGVVASCLAKGWGQLAEMDQLQHARSLLCDHEAVLRDASTNHLTSRSDSLMESFCTILYDEAFHCTTNDDLQPTLLEIEKLLRVIRSRIRIEELSSVTFKVMERLKDNWYNIDSSSLHRVKYVMLNILNSDNATYVDSKRQTLLHLVIYCFSPEELHVHYLQDLARTFVRHGCPIDVENDEGKTASGILQMYRMYDHEDDYHQELLKLVSPPTAVVRLWEQAFTTVSRHNIPHWEYISREVYNMMSQRV